MAASALHLRGASWLGACGLAFALALAALPIVPAPAAAQTGAVETFESLPSSSYYIVTRVDARLCPTPFCGGVFVALVNRRWLVCPDGSIQEECHAPIVDWSLLRLDPEREAQVAAEFAARRVLARGDLVLRSSAFGELPTLVVSDAWRGVTGNEPGGHFFGLVPTGIVCITYPCPTLKGRLLNLRRGYFFHDLDLASSGATSDQIAEGLRSLFEGPGLLVAGTARLVSGPAGFGTQLVAREFYTRVEAGPGARACDPASPCPEGEFCEQVPGTCGSWEQPGVCTPMGEACPAVVDPVCGCDGVTYGNDCLRQLAGVSLDHPGPCKEL